MSGPEPMQNLEDRPDPERRIALAIDLDGTLCHTDSLHEALAALAAKRPGLLLQVARRLNRGKVATKTLVADLGLVPADALPYREEVLALARAARAAGREVILVSASDQRQVDAVAAHLGLFDAAFGTGPQSANLSGQTKADFLIARYGAGGFDYAGDAAVDLPV